MNFLLPECNLYYLYIYIFVIFIILPKCNIILIFFFKKFIFLKNLFIINMYEEFELDSQVIC